MTTIVYIKSKWYLYDIDILEYEENEVALKNITENNENWIKDLNRRMNRLKINEIKSWISRKE